MTDNCAAHGGQRKTPSRVLRPLADSPSIKPANDDVDVSASLGRGHFYGIDLPTFREACSLGLNEAIAYLILARGTQADNRTTTWSTNSITAYTRLGRDKAKRAIEDLLGSGLIADEGGPAHRPIRTLYPAPRGEFLLDNAEPLSGDKSELLRTLPVAGRLPKAKSKRLEALARAGWVDVGEGRYSLGKNVRVTKPRNELVWLPNTIVDGLGDADAPCELIRQTQCVHTLLLFVMLYCRHELTFSQGVPHNELCRTYSRKEVAGYRSFNLYEFSPKGHEVMTCSPIVSMFEETESIRPADEQFWESFEVLEKLGLVSFVPHLFDGPKGEVLYPIVRPADGADITDAEAALYEAVSGAISPFQTRSFVVDPQCNPHFPIYALVQNHMKKVQLRGVARMRHRPRTQVTAEWMAQSARWEEYAEFYSALGDEIRQAKAA